MSDKAAVPGTNVKITISRLRIREQEVGADFLWEGLDSRVNATHCWWDPDWDGPAEGK